MMKVLVALAACLALASASAGSLSWDSCDKTAICPVNNVTMNPDPAPRGGATVFSIFCNANSVTTGGKITVDVKVDGNHVKTETYDLCQVVSCPAPAGARVSVQKEDIPSIAPRGAKISTKTVVTDTSGKSVSCVDINFQVG